MLRALGHLTGKKRAEGTERRDRQRAKGREANSRASVPEASLQLKREKGREREVELARGATSTHLTSYCTIFCLVY